MKPFDGILFCLSGFSEPYKFKTINSRILKLGGDLATNLIKATQVLVIDSFNIETEKFKFTIKHRPDIVILNSNSIEELYQLWLAGEDITLKNHSNFELWSKCDEQQTERMLMVLRSIYNYLPFENFYIFIGRINTQIKKKKKSSNENNAITDVENETITENITSKSLKQICLDNGCRECNTDNFIVDITAQKPNMKIVFISDTLDSRRVEAALEYNIPVVHYKWILDCQKRGGTLQFEPYYLLKNLINKNSSRSSLDYDSIGTGSCQCWELLDQFRFNNNNIRNDNRLLGPDAGKQNEKDEVKPLPIDKSKNEKYWNKIINESLSNNSLSKSLNESFLFKNTGKNNSIIQTNFQSKENKVKNILPLFNGCNFILHKTFSTRHLTILQDVIVSNGGIVLNKEMTASNLLENDSHYHVVPSNIPLDVLENNSDIPKRYKVQVVTEFFLERCLHYKTLINPPDNWCKPFFKTKHFNIESVEKLKKISVSNNAEPISISITGFNGVELLHLTKILKLLQNHGFKFNEYLNKKTDLLLLNLVSLGNTKKTAHLWGNEYNDLFKLNWETMHSNESETNNTNNEQMFLLKSSLKKKLEFIKLKHSIPVVTPAFIFELFKMTSPVNKYDKCKSHGKILEQVKINDTRWCIIFSKNTESALTYNIVYNSETNSEKTTENDDSLRESSKRAQFKRVSKPDASDLFNRRARKSLSPQKPTTLSERQKEIINNIRTASNSDDKRSYRYPIKSKTANSSPMKLNQDDSTNSKQVKRRRLINKSAIDLNLNSAVPNLTKTTSNLIEYGSNTNADVVTNSNGNAGVKANPLKREPWQKAPLERTTSWGTLMSAPQDDDIHANNNNTSQDNTRALVEQKTSQNNSEIKLTQITYGL